MLRMSDPKRRKVNDIKQDNIPQQSTQHQQQMLPNLTQNLFQSNSHNVSPMFSPVNLMLLNNKVQNDLLGMKAQNMAKELEVKSQLEFLSNKIFLQNSKKLNDEENKRVEKNRREKQRREQLNEAIKRLATLLDLPPNSGTEKIVILRKAADELEKYKREKKQ